jgi:hypothetical protein
MPFAAPRWIASKVSYKARRNSLSPFASSCVNHEEHDIEMACAGIPNCLRLRLPGMASDVNNPSRRVQHFFQMANPPAC